MNFNWLSWLLRRTRTPNPELRTDPINFHSSAPIVGLRTGERVCLGAVCASGKTKLGKFNEFMLVASPL